MMIDWRRQACCLSLAGRLRHDRTDASYAADEYGARPRLARRPGPAPRVAGDHHRLPRVHRRPGTAAILAQLLRADLLPEAWIAPQPVRQLRAVLRHRASLVRLRTQLRNRIHAVAADHGYDRTSSYWTEDEVGRHAVTDNSHRVTFDLDWFALGCRDQSDHLDEAVVR
jgi:hypothetical protein